MAGEELGSGVVFGAAHGHFVGDYGAVSALLFEGADAAEVDLEGMAGLGGEGVGGGGVEEPAGMGVGRVGAVLAAFGFEEDYLGACVEERVARRRLVMKGLRSCWMFLTYNFCGGAPIVISPYHCSSAWPALS